MEESVRTRAANVILGGGRRAAVEPLVEIERNDSSLNSIASSPAWESKSTSWPPVRLLV